MGKWTGGDGANTRIPRRSEKICRRQCPPGQTKVRERIKNRDGKKCGLASREVFSFSIFYCVHTHLNPDKDTYKYCQNEEKTTSEM